MFFDGRKNVKFSIWIIIIQNSNSLSHINISDEFFGIQYERVEMKNHRHLFICFVPYMLGEQHWLWNNADLKSRNGIKGSFVSRTSTNALENNKIIHVCCRLGSITLKNKCKSFSLLRQLLIELRKYIKSCSLLH